MKRQRNTDSENVKAKRVESTAAPTTRITAMGKRKGKKAVGQQTEEVKTNGEDSSPRMVENYMNWGELPWLRGAVDEQMSWGSIWLPVWDVEYMGEACSEMFSDVIWDYDIWNLRNINEIPNP
ncbi:hypothetical protein RCOM_0030010 [Ricinus communis]|uniref:Uncharacterized protein n=1 Tax=Ricinus communis TaxID=3988 RepID=B9T054_RICCO|nr:hypothetical protein RCOM_0030010 [Ricinus communis]|eukprot:XP_002531623.1 uncharacterized protein LOC8285780 [Ricinus communis]